MRLRGCERPRHFTLLGQRLGRAFAARGEDGSVSFTVVARDMHFNKLPRGGDFLDVKLVSAAGQASAFESAPFLF